MTWLRAVALALLLGVLLLGAGRLATRPTLLMEPIPPPVPRLIRRGGEAPALDAEAALIVRLRSGEVLLERNVGIRLPIASLTKLMTALILAGEAQPLAEVEFSSAATAVAEPDYKRSGAAAGEQFHAEDIQRMLLISSDNDAAYAAAEHVARTRRPDLASFKERIGYFVGLMNERAAAMGLADTHFANPAGFDDPQNYSSASDLVRLAGAIIAERPELWTFSRVSETFVFSADGRRHGVVNTNPLLREYPAIYGSKTGYEDEARGALLILYQLSRDEFFAIVLLRSGDRFGDGRAAIRWLEENFSVEQ